MLRMFRLFGVLLAVLTLAACAGGGSPPATVAQTSASPATATLAASAPTLNPPTQVPTVAPKPPTAAPATPEPTAEAAGVLPAPLYYVMPRDGKDQIFRLEADGVTNTQITDEAAAEGVGEYAISPADGALAYVSGNNLIRTDKLGGNRTVLVEGPVISDPDDSNARQAGNLSSPLWSPDGSQIAFGLGGINLIPASGGEAQLILRHEEQADPALAEMFKFAVLRDPVSWSPDGTKLLTNHTYVPEGFAYVVVDLATLSEVLLEGEEGLLCCSPVWSAAGGSIYFGSDSIGMISAGLWEADTATGVVTRLIGPPNGEPPWALVKAAMPVGNDAFVAFYQQTADEAVANGESGRTLTMTQINADGSTAPLRSGPTDAGEVLWAPDARGAVVSGSPSEPAALEWLPSADGPAVPLNGIGYRLAWGQ